MSRPCLLLVGRVATRDYIVKAVVCAARKLDMPVVLISDHPVQDDLGLFDTLVTDLDTHTSTLGESLCQRVKQYLDQRSMTTSAVYSPFDRFVPVASVLASQLNVGANAYGDVSAAVLKARMRDLFADDPALAIPYCVTDKLVDAVQWVAQHAATWVMKPSRGAGSRGVMSGIRNAQDVRAAWDSIKRRENLVHTSVRKDEAILLEMQLSGPEVDVELVLQNGDVKFAAVADNPLIAPPYQIETSSTYPSQLPETYQQAFIEHALAGLHRLELKNGNFHVELIGTAEGPKIIEINPRMGGAFVWHAIKSAYHIDLIELGIFSLYQLAPDFSEARAKETIEASFFIAPESGILEAVQGFRNLSELPFVRHAELWKHPGDSVFSPHDSPSDYMGFVLCAGDTHAQALTHTATALNLVQFQISSLSQIKSIDDAPN